MTIDEYLEDSERDFLENINILSVERTGNKVIIKAEETVYFYGEKIIEKVTFSTIERVMVRSNHNKNYQEVNGPMKNALLAEAERILNEEGRT